MVERFNGRIADVLKTHHFHSGQDLEQTLMRYVTLYNHQLPQSALKSKTPMQAMKEWYASRPDLFHKRPYDRPGCDKYVAVGDAATHRVLRIDHGGQVDALEQAPDQGQATVAAQIVGQLLDNEFNRISHVHFLHPQGEQQIWAKCLLYIGNCHFFVGEVTDSGEPQTTTDAPHRRKEIRR